jgi:hypothetical protein|tara:strand:+ start:591 stop:821 length:231 start_codon:yes stop_codon:yes gene_type:complete
MYVIKPLTVVRDIIKTVEVRDPTGLIRNDIAFLKKHTKEVHWKAGTTLEQIAYQQGQVDVISTIETKVVGRRVDRL